jgi:hypothetical protein
MKKLGLSLLGVGLLVAGCASTPSTPLMAFADTTTSTKELDAEMTEMSMIDSFQSMGRLGQMPMGFGIGVHDDTASEEVLYLQETLGQIHETMQAVHALRFYVVLEGDVFKTLAIAFEDQALQFSEADAIAFNELVDTFSLTKTNVKRIYDEGKSIRQEMGSIIRSMNRPRTFDVTQITALQTLADSLYETILPLPELVSSMLDHVQAGQALLEPYFLEGTSPITLETREQLQRIYGLKDQLDEKQVLLRQNALAIREAIQTIRETLAALKDAGVSLTAEDQAQLNLLRITLQNRMENHRDQREGMRSLFKSLRGNVRVEFLDTIEEKFTLINEALDETMLTSQAWLATLQQWVLTLAAY